MINLKNKHILVTGGAGFLGKHLVAKLKKRGCKDIFIPLIEDYDLVNMEAIKQLYADAKPNIVIHLAARAGVKIMIDADMRASGLKAIGEGDKILEKKFPHRWWKAD